MNFNIEKIRADFPVLHQEVYGKPLVYLDNAATTQKPVQVLQQVTEFYSKYNSNIHRGVHYLSEKATELYEQARKTVQQYINAPSETEVIFTKGTTEAINTVAFSFGEAFVKEGDEIIVSEMEHHSNIVPWQLLCSRKKAILKVIPFNDKGELLLEQLPSLLTEKTRLLAVTYVSNSLGTINPVQQIIQTAHKAGVPVLIDAAQAVQHFTLDVQALDCDFLVFSGHKLYAETGIGVLYGKTKWLEQMPPYQGGGDMIKNVSFAGSTWADLPLKFEAGTSNFAAAVSMAEAIKYIQNIGLQNIQAYENLLLQTATEKLGMLDNMEFYGTAASKCSVISFNIKGVHPYDAGQVLDKLGIAVRTGTHCTEPVMQHFNISGTVRASFAFYNTLAEIDTLTEGIKRVQKLFL